MTGAVIGTGGHIDHGKTALVRALTGVDTDRLPEEKRRGISIDLGFTRLDIAGRSIGVVDVPGHEDFIRNMLAGATGIDLLLLVVAADEGVMPQTREHVAIAELLAVPKAVVALTKQDLVAPEWLELARTDVLDFLRATPFAHAPVVEVSATTGAGLDALRDAIAAAAVPRRRDDDLFRLPVDRSFTVRGTGTVVTGTVWSGVLEREQAVRLLPDGAQARVRGLQVHDRDVDRVEAGNRAAIALAGLDRGDARRGAVVVTSDAWTAASVLTVRLRLLRSTAWTVRQRQRVRVHLGTDEVMGRVRLLSADRLEPGDEAWGQLRLEEPLVARAGDLLVLRSYSPVTTIGGGVVLEPNAPKRRRLSTDDVANFAALASGVPPKALAARLAAAGVEGVRTERLSIETGFTVTVLAPLLASDAVVQAGGRVFDAAALSRVRAAIRDAVAAYHQAEPLRPGMPLEDARRAAPSSADRALVELAVEQAAAAGELELRDGVAALPGFAPTLTASQAALRDRVADVFARAGAEPPRVAELRQALEEPPGLEAILTLLEADGTLVRLEADLYVDRAALDRLARAVREQLGGRDALGPADFRTVMPVSRKFLIPLLTHLDGLGVTVRRGEGRFVPR